MTCAWQELLSLVPSRWTAQTDRLGKETLQELRLRRGQPLELVCANGIFYLSGAVTEEDLNFCVNVASHYSPWAAQTLASGYVTARGGHRIGVCGDGVIKEARMCSIREITSLCIRVARDFPGIAEGTTHMGGSILLLGPPGSGKTTMLRDLIRLRSEKEQVSVVDERGELFPPGFSRGKRVDVLTGCPKRQGIDILLRAMGPAAIAVDEITAAEDCEALIQACRCGVRLLATAHAFSAEDLLRRAVYRPLVEERIFEHILLLRQDKTWRQERMTL